MEVRTKKSGKQQKAVSKYESSEHQNLGESICYVCSKIVLDGEEALQCEICEFWLHIKCVGMSKKVYEVLKDGNATNIHWYCNPCNKGTGRILAGVATLELRQSKLKQDMADLQKDVNEVKLCTGKIGGMKDDCSLLSSKISVVVSKFEDFD